MRSRAATILLLVATTLFLNVVVPGHTRGIITLPGTGKSAAADTSTCSVESSGDCCHARPAAPATGAKGKKQPTEQDRKNCAVCFVAAHFTPPPAVDFSPPPLGLSDVLPPPPAWQCPFVAITPAYYGRGPPAA